MNGQGIWTGSFDGLRPGAESRGPLGLTREHTAEGWPKSLQATAGGSRRFAQGRTYDPTGRFVVGGPQGDSGLTGRNHVYVALAEDFRFSLQ